MSKSNNGPDGTSRIRPNLSFVPPERRAVVEARIAIIEAYMDKEGANTSDAVQAARKLGVALSTFYALVRVWRNTHDPMRLAGAGNKGRSPKGKTRTDDDFIRAALSKLPVGDSVEEDVTELIAYAAGQGIALRSVPLLRQLVRELRPQHDDMLVDGDLVLAKTALMLPVDHVGAPTMPIASVLAHAATGRVLSIHLAMTDEGYAAFAKTLLSAIEHGLLVHGGQRSASLIIGGRAGEEFSDLTMAIVRAGLHIVPDRPYGRTRANEWTARRVEGLKLKARPRFSHRNFEARRIPDTTDLNQPVAICEATTMIAQRIAAQPGFAPISFDADFAMLKSGLTSLIDDDRTSNPDVR